MSTRKISRKSKRAKTSVRSRPYHKGNVAEDLLAAARRLSVSEGLESITVRRLCREVDVSPANFYNHYPSTQYLLLEVAAEGAEMMMAIIDRASRRYGSREDQLVEIAAQSVEFGIEHPDLFRVMFGQVPGGPSHQRYYSTILASFGRLVRVIYGEDLYRPGNQAWSYANLQKAYAFFAFVYGLIRLITMGMLEFPKGTRTERQHFVRDVARQTVRGLMLSDAPAD